MTQEVNLYKASAFFALKMGVKKTDYIQLGNLRNVWVCKLFYDKCDSSIWKHLCYVFLCMFVWLRVQGYDSSVNKDSLKEKEY